MMTGLMMVQTPSHLVLPIEDRRNPLTALVGLDVNILNRGLTPIRVVTRAVLWLCLPISLSTLKN